MTFSTLTKKDVGKTFTILAKVENIHQTTGPTLFKLFDGTSHFVAKAFLNPGERAYPKIEKDMVVEVELRIQEYEGKLEGSIASMEYRDEGLFEQKLKELKDSKMKINSVPFLIKSETLEKLRPSFEKAAMLIKQAIYDDRPIILRHNADCDGYSGAVALEKAVLPLIIERHSDNYSQWRYYRRAPSKAPFYSVGDGMFDVVSAANDMMKGVKAPLVIVLDNGSGKEDLFSIKNVKVYSCPVIVVDHHFVGEDVISAEVDVHINPYLVGGNSHICAGMLGAELSRFIKDADVSFIPALAGVADKVEGDEMDQYVALAGDVDLKKLALVVDFVAYTLRAEGRGFIQDLYDKPERFVELYYAEAQKRMDEALKVGQHYVKVEEGEKNIATLDLSGVSLMGEFPAFGKTTGLVSDWLNEKYRSVYVLGLAKDMIVLRVSKSEVAFNLNDIVKQLKEKMPHAGVSGGGHERAGTIKFVAAAKEEVLEFVKRFINQ